MQREVRPKHLLIVKRKILRCALNDKRFFAALRSALNDKRFLAALRCALNDKEECHAEGGTTEASFNCETEDSSTPTIVGML